jgi:hypothetical protein
MISERDLPNELDDMIKVLDMELVEAKARAARQSSKISKTKITKPSTTTKQEFNFIEPEEVFDDPVEYQPSEEIQLKVKTSKQKSTKSLSLTEQNGKGKEKKLN